MKNELIVQLHISGLCLIISAMVYLYTKYQSLSFLPLIFFTYEQGMITLVEIVVKKNK